MPAMNLSLLATQTGYAQLRRLILLRAVAVLAQGITLLLVRYVLEMQLPWLPMLMCVGLLAVFNLFSWLRLRTDFPVSNMELFGQLCVDVFALSLLLYYAGGSTNPFISLYLLPLVIAAATLPQRYTWAMAILTTACYSLLMKYYQPLPGIHAASADGEMTAVMSGLGHDHMHMLQAEPQDAAFNMHVIGMWLGFVISAVVVAYFVEKMANAVRKRDEKLARIREQTLRNERIVALGMQAASAAHEMGTPLATLSVVIGELQQEANALPEWRESLALLDGQVRNCKRILDKLLANAQEDAGLPAPQSLEQFVSATLDEWQLLRPTVQHRYHASGPQPAPQLRIDPALRAALLNLLNNAADVSPQEMDIYVHWDDANFTFEIQDYGHGLTPEAAANAGSAFFSTKKEGHGLGLFLANATIEQLGGKVRLFNREGGGATTEVVLPLHGRDA
jgi:two-component system sensor histidine kinase RegB